MPLLFSNRNKSLAWKTELQLTFLGEPWFVVCKMLIPFAKFLDGIRPFHATNQFKTNHKLHLNPDFLQMEIFCSLQCTAFN